MNALTRFLKPSTRGSIDAGLLLLRLGFGLTLAFGHGLNKALALGKFIKSVTRHGFPIPEIMGPLAMLSELAGGILLALGLFTRPAAGFVIATMLGAAFVAHGGDPFSKKESRARVRARRPRAHRHGSGPLFVRCPARKTTLTPPRARRVNRASPLPRRSPSSECSR